MTKHSQKSDDDAIVIDHDDISNYNPEHILPEAPEEIKKIRTWLKATDYAHESGEFHKHLASHMAGTGSWLTSSDVFRRWIEGCDRGMLWVTGIPGSGKSVVAAHLIDFLTQYNRGAPVLYFFFRQIIDANHEPTALLRDWLDQVLEYSPPLQKQLKELVKANRSITSLSMDDLFNYLRLAFANLPNNVFCVADALDEMDGGNDEFLKSLVALGTWKPSKARVLITSRPVPSVEVPLRHAKMLRIRLEEDIVDVDISSFVERGLRSSRLPLDEQGQIREAVPGRANGIFLYAKLAMDAFLEPGAQVADVLRTLPADLHEMYTSLLQQHAIRSGVPHDIQLLILQWVTHATRPLRLLELAEMISVTFRTSGHSGPKHDLASAKNLVRAAAGPLLEILPNETVCVIHHSFTEYLKCMTRSETDGGYPILLPGSAHGRLALACLSYLQTGCLDTVTVESEGNNHDEDEDDDDDGMWESMEDSHYYGRQSQIGHDEQRIRLTYPFFAYATANWQSHVARSAAAGLDQKNINTALNQFFDDKQRTKAWLKLEWANDDHSSKNITLLHIAARYGLTDFARDLVRKGADINAGDIFGKTPLWWAADKGHAAIIKLLVEAGANPDVEDKICGLKPLHQAASENHGDAVCALLEAGVDPLTPKTREDPGRRCGNAPRSTGHTPLMYACHNGHLEALDAFLPFLPDIDTVHRALAWSAAYGRPKHVSRILRQPGVQVNAKIRGDTPLYLACRLPNRDTIRILLEEGADPTILCKNSGDGFGGIGSRMYLPNSVKDNTRGYTALHALCSTGGRGRRSDKGDSDTLQELFALLVEKGAKVDQRTNNGSTLLHAAVDNPVLVRLLLHAGADANAVDDSGRAPLHTVMSPDSVSLLVEEGQADINLINPYDGRSPLLLMLQQYDADIVLKLLQYHPDLSIKDKKGNGPLHIALSQSSTTMTIVKELLITGADPDQRNRNGETPLLMMRMDNRGSVAMIDLLIKAGADINAKDRSGMTVLSRAMRSSSSTKSSHSDVTELLAKGADLHVCDFKGRTLLHHAVAGHQGTRASAPYGEEVVTRFDFLLGLGMDVQALDYRGNTLLHELALQERILDSYHGPLYIPLWHQLLSLGIDVNQANQQGRTALHILAATDPCSNGVQTYKPGHFGPLDLVISKAKNVDQRDHQGLTALHLASTVSEYTAKKLLDAGGDPTLASFDGLTPLHLAARARQSNVVGLLLAFTKDSLNRAVDAKDEKGNTPLYYACRSGRLETVKLLLEAGADATQKALFLACAAFEEEQRLWDKDLHPADMELNQSASGLTINDTTRPPIPSTNNMRSKDLDDRRDSTRLEEIVDLLVVHGCDTTGLVGPGDYYCDTGALEDAAKAHRTYTFNCLLRACKMITCKDDKLSVVGTRMEDDIVKAYQHAGIADVSNITHLKANRANRRTVVHFLKERQYHEIRSLFDQGVNFLDQSDDSDLPSNLELFVEHGYTSLLKEIGGLEAERQLESGKWHAFGDTLKPGLYMGTDPNPANEEDSSSPRNILLLTALERDLPNMDVVRVLVEEFHVDVNQRHYKTTYIDGKYEMAPQETALHYLAKGLHWWHTALAMPYLIEKGAILDTKDYNGYTPLHVAVGVDQYLGPFHKDAAKVLIAAGANVDTQDNKGHSCFASTVENEEMLQLFLDHGASIQADVVFMVIKNRQVDVLMRLLKAGADANMRLKPDPSFHASKSTSRKRRTWSGQEADPLPHEIYPLYVASTMHGVSHFPLRSAEKRLQDSLSAIQLVETLLAAGADPYATFNRRKQYHSALLDQDTDDHGGKAQESVNDSLTTEYEEVTLLHELLNENEMVHPILNLETLDPNCRDAQGRTILHMACHDHCLGAPIDSLLTASNEGIQSSTPSFLECLLKRGADPTALDHQGRGIIHHIFENKQRQLNNDRDTSMLIQLAKDYPVLLNQPDSHGKTALHVALEHAVYQCDTLSARTLLDAGADAFATDADGNGCLHILALRIYRNASIRTLFTELVGKGLDINSRNERGEPPIFNLNRHVSGHTEPKPEESIGAIEALGFFEELGADIFATDNLGRGLLHITAKETVEPVKVDRYPWMQSGTKKEEPSITRFQTLIGKGLDPMMEDGKKRTALDVAAACGKESVLKLFEKDKG